MGFVRNFLGVSVSNYRAIALSFALNVVLTWRLGTERFGRLALLIMAVQVLANVIFNWTLTGLIRFGAQEFAKNGSVAESFWSRLVVIHVASEWSLDLDTIGLDCEEQVRTRTPEELRAAVRALLSEAGDCLAERRRRGRALAARFFGQTREAAYRPVLDALAQPSGDLGADTPALSSVAGRL